MTEFDGIQSAQPVTPSQYHDPMQWWYELSLDEQDAWRKQAAAFAQDVMTIVGLNSMPRNDVATPDNPYGINRTVLKRYKQILAERGDSAKPLEMLITELRAAMDQVDRIRASINTYHIGIQA